MAGQSGSESLAEKHKTTQTDGRLFPLSCMISSEQERSMALIPQLLFVLCIFCINSTQGFAVLSSKPKDMQSLVLLEDKSTMCQG